MRSDLAGSCKRCGGSVSKGTGGMQDGRPVHAWCMGFYLPGMKEIDVNNDKPATLISLLTAATVGAIKWDGTTGGKDGVPRCFAFFRADGQRWPFGKMVKDGKLMEALWNNAENLIYALRDEESCHELLDKAKVVRVGEHGELSVWGRIEELIHERDELRKVVRGGEHSESADKCPGDGMCHGPASWCVFCGDTFRMCDDAKNCDMHGPGGDRDQQENKGEWVGSHPPVWKTHEEVREEHVRHVKPSHEAPCPHPEPCPDHPRTPPEKSA